LTSKALVASETDTKLEMKFN